MSYVEKKGNIFNSKAQVLGNTVNCFGVMGKGIALEYRRRFPQMYLAYQKDCKQKKLIPGHIYYYPDNQILIMNITTKNHWRNPSRLEWITGALEQFVHDYKTKKIKNIAMPILGTQSGGLDREKVLKIMREYLQNLEDIDIEVYEYDPSGGDPLFRTLEKISKGNYPERFLLKAGIPSIHIMELVNSVKNNEIHSLAELTEANILGKKALDKLYIELTQKEQAGTSQQVIQPKLFE